MKTGKVAAMFKVDPKTIINWTEEFKKFFSPEAQGIGLTQRQYNPDDLIVLNTIHALKMDRIDAPEIHSRLEAGERNGTLPPEAAVMGADTAINVYAQLRVYQAQLDQLRQDNSRLQNEGREKDGEIAQLNQEIGKWKAMYEMLKGQLDDED